MIITANTKFVPQNYVLERLGISRPMIRALRERGVLKPAKLNDRVLLYPLEQIQRLEERLSSPE